MKADLTKQEVRAAFMAQYIGQPVLFVGAMCYQLHADDFRTIITREQPLSLRHISSLTGKEKSEIRAFFPWEGSVERLVEYIILNEWLKNFDTGMRECDFEDILHLIDYLRSIGILIPYRGNSCEEIIEAGLAVYRKEGE